jgi:hypothetical protein
MIKNMSFVNKNEKMKGLLERKNSYNPIIPKIGNVN